MSGGAAAMRASALWPSPTVSASRPCCFSSRTRKPAMSGSSSTTRTRNAPFAARPAAAWTAASFIDDLHPREVFGVLHEPRLEAGTVARLGAVLDDLAEVRDLFEAVGVAYALHAMPDLPELLEIACGERCLEGFELLAAVGHEGGNQVLEVL